MALPFKTIPIYPVSTRPRPENQTANQHRRPSSWAAIKPILNCNKARPIVDDWIVKIPTIPVLLMKFKYRLTQQSRGRNREDKLRDCKEKYRRMASPSSRRIKPAGGRLNSWKKKADERLEKAQKVKPWYVPEQEEEEENANKDDKDDVSPMKAKKHMFDEDEMRNDKAASFQANKGPVEGAPEDEKDELLVDEVSSFQPAIAVQEPVKPAPSPKESPAIAPSTEPDNEVPQTPTARRQAIHCGQEEYLYSD